MLLRIHNKESLVPTASIPEQPFRASTSQESGPFVRADVTPLIFR